MDAIVK